MVYRLNQPMMSRSLWVGLLYCALTTTASLATPNRIAQSVYRFIVKPEFMVLSLYPDSKLFGYTSSVWDEEFIESGVAHYKTVIVGKVVASGKIEISFYAHEALDLAMKRAEASRLPCLDRSNAQCLMDTLRELIPEVGVPPLETEHFSFGRRRDNSDTRLRNVWAAQNNHQSADDYLDFVYQGDFYSADSAEAMLIDHSIGAYHGANDTVPPGLFRIYGGTPSLDSGFDAESKIGVAPADLKVHTRSCERDNVVLQRVLSQAAGWEAHVYSAGQMSFRVILKSHSDREFFYRDGFWWKAFLQISFYSDIEGECVGASIYLYDTVVCAAHHKTTLTEIVHNASSASSQHREPSWICRIVCV